MNRFTLIGNTNPILPFFLFCMFLSIYSCGSKEVYEGIYKAQDETSPRNAETQIELREKGIGVWRVLGEEAAFRWDIKDSEIWVSTKLGGIIIGKIQGEIIEITLPGLKAMTFRKAI